MHPTRLAQRLAGRFQHDPLAGRHLPQRGDLLARHHARVHVRQQRRLLQHQRAHLSQIGDRRLVPQSRQRLLGGAIAQLRLVAEREQRLRASRRLAGTRDRQHFLARQIRGMAGPRPLGERAVMAHVPAQLRQRNEDLARVGQIAPVRGIPRLARLGDQLGQRRRFDPVSQGRVGHGHPGLARVIGPIRSSRRRFARYAASDPGCRQTRPPHGSHCPAPAYAG